MEEVVKPLTDIPAINRFLSYCRVRTVPSKTVLIHAGDLPDVLYYIIRGSVEVMIEDEEGNEMVLAYLNKGQFFGEMGLFSDSQQRSAWVRTRTHCELAEMTYPRFRQIAAESPGLVFNPATPLDWLDYTIRSIDLVLLMSVNPGFGGQKFIISALDKLAEARRRIDASGRAVRLEIDGGVKIDNIGDIARAGADSFVAGSAIFGSKDYAKTIAAMRDAIKRGQAPL